MSDEINENNASPAGTPPPPASPTQLPVGDERLASVINQFGAARSVDGGAQSQAAPDAIAERADLANKTTERKTVGVRVFLLQRDISLPPTDDYPSGLMLPTGRKVTERGLTALSPNLVKRLLNAQVTERVPTLVVVGTVSEADYAQHGESVVDLVQS